MDACPNDEEYLDISAPKTCAVKYLAIAQRRQMMSKNQNGKKKDEKKKPTKTLKEKKQAKREKKAQKDSPGILT